MKVTIDLRTVIMLVVVIAVVVVYSTLPRAGASAHANFEAPSSKVATAPLPAVALASPGRIEGRSDIVDVGAAMDGVIRVIHVKEGQMVRRGEVLADLACDDLQSALQVAVARQNSSNDARLRLQRGSRPEERAAATEKTAAAEAIREQAMAQLTRMSKLYASEEISKLSFDEAKRDRDVAEANYQRAKKNEELVDAGPLPEDLARADADFNAAQAGVQFAQDKVGKCVVRAPMNGSILRVLLRAGESFSLTAAHPIFAMADISRRRVRAEVDEDDIAKVHVGQKLLVSADAFSNRTFSGVVTHVSSVMGRKTVITGDPAQKADRDILEVTADLDRSAKELPVGLRVTVQFER